MSIYLPNTLVMSLKRLFLKGKVSHEKVMELLAAQKITQIDVDYIMKEGIKNEQI